MAPDTPKRIAAMSKGVNVAVAPSRDTMLKPDQNSTTMSAASKPLPASGLAV